MDVYQRLFYERLSEIFLNEDITTTCRLVDMAKKMREATFRCMREHVLKRDIKERQENRIIGNHYHILEVYPRKHYSRELSRHL